MIERGRDDTGVAEPQVVRCRCGREQREVARVRQHRGMQQQPVGHGARRAQPHTQCMLAFALDVIPNVERVPLAALDRVPRPVAFGQSWQGVGGSDDRHRVLVLEPVLIDLERRGHVEDRAFVLPGDDATGAERAAVSRVLHDVLDRHRRVAGAQEVAVQRVGSTLLRDGAAASHERLREHLPTEDTLQRGLGRDTAQDEVVHLLELEQ